MVFFLLSKKTVPASEPYVEETGPVFHPFEASPVISGPASAPYVEHVEYVEPERLPERLIYTGGYYTEEAETERKPVLEEMLSY